LNSSKSECGAGGRLKISIDEFHRSNPTSEDEEHKTGFGHHASSSSSKSDSGNGAPTGLQTKVHDLHSI
jgi:hypothetical protein